MALTDPVTPHDPPPATLPREMTRPSGSMDAALYGILLGNAFTLAGALWQHWPAAPILWIYWGQSVAIGLINVIRILSLHEFSTSGFTSGGRPVPETPASKVSTALFFSVHYGMFHLVYAVFLASGKFAGAFPAAATWTVWGNIATFAVAHAIPLVKGGGNDLRQKRPNLGSLMFYPYLRIIPMHLTIIFGSMLPQGALPLFIVLKTGADAGMHAIERALFTDPE